MNQDGSIEALTLADKPLRWTRLDDTVMGGSSHTHLIDANDKHRKSDGGNKVQKQAQQDTADSRKTRKHPKKLHFEGTINKTASVGFASVRAKLPEPLVPENKRMPQALAITARGDGLTYKVLLMDNRHNPWNSSSVNSPLWEADLPTRTGTKSRLGSQHTWTLPLAEFVPTYMGQPANEDKLKLKPSEITRIGFMLSSRLSNGSLNRTYDTQPDVFDFCLEVHDIKVVPDFEFGDNSILEEEGK